MRTKKSPRGAFPRARRRGFRARDATTRRDDARMEREVEDALQRPRGAHARALSACFDHSTAWARALADTSFRDDAGDLSWGAGAPRTGFSSTMRARERSISSGDADGIGLECVAELTPGWGGGEGDAPCTEEEKRERRMQANRLSAAKSRMKKMRRVVELEGLCETKLARVNELTADVAALREQSLELQSRNQHLHALKNTCVIVSKKSIPCSASMEMLESIANVNEPLPELSIDDDDFARQTSLDSVFDSDIFLASPSPKSPT